MNKKILLSLGIIGVVAAVAVAGTMAYFSDTAVSTSNSFISGTLDLKLSDTENGSYSHSITGTFDMDNMAPGVSETTGTVWLKNTGSADTDHVSITSVVNTPSDNGVNEPECKAYNGEWKWWGGTNPRRLCVLSASVIEATCASYGGEWYNFETEWPGYGSRCYAEIGTGFKDGLGAWNDMDKYLQVTSIKYAGEELKFSGGNVVVNFPSDTRADINTNGYIDLDDLGIVAATEGSWLDNLTPPPGTSGNTPHTFKMTVKLHSSADNRYQTDKSGIEIEFTLNQDSSQ